MTCAAPFSPTASRQTHCPKHQKPRSNRYGGSWARLKAKVIERDNGICAYCGRSADSADHVLPVSKGGTDDMSNLVACCRACNYSKQDKDAAEFAKHVRIRRAGKP